MSDRVNFINVPGIEAHRDKFKDEETYRKALLTSIPDPMVSDAIAAEGLIDITGIDVVELIVEMYNRAHPVGMGYLHGSDTDTIDYEEAGMIYDTLSDMEGNLNIDYYKGKPIKLRMKAGSMMVDPRAYDDRQDTPGLLASIVASLR